MILLNSILVSNLAHGEGGTFMVLSQSRLNLTEVGGTRRLPVLLLLLANVPLYLLF